MNNEHRHPDPVQEFSKRVEEAWPLTLDPSPRAIHVSSATARGEGRVRGHANSNVSGAMSNEQCAICAMSNGQWAMDNAQFDEARPEALSPYENFRSTTPRSQAPKLRCRKS